MNEQYKIFYHGGVEADFDISKIDILRTAEKQQKNNRNYSGFYMYDENNKQSAIYYANQENSIKNTTDKGIIKIVMSNDLNIYEVPPFSITRIKKETLIELKEKGYDLIAGKMLNKIEYVLLNKDKIIEIQFEQISKIKEHYNTSNNTIQKDIHKNDYDEER